MSEDDVKHKTMQECNGLKYTYEGIEYGILGTILRKNNIDITDEIRTTWIPWIKEAIELHFTF